MAAEYVEIDSANEQYIIDRPGGRELLGFDDCMYRILDYGMELAGRLRLPGEFIDTPVDAQRGTLEAYTVMCNLRDELIAAAEEDGETAIAGLSPQLDELEGHAVEAVTKTGETRQFIVGLSNDAIPHHVEITKTVRNAEREYKSVRDLGEIHTHEG